MEMVTDFFVCANYLVKRYKLLHFYTPPESYNQQNFDDSSQFSL